MHSLGPDSSGGGGQVEAGTEPRPSPDPPLILTTALRALDFSTENIIKCRPIIPSDSLSPVRSWYR